MAGRKLAGLDGRKVVAALQRAGFEVLRIKGSHHVLRKDGSPALTVIVPVHGAKDIPVGTVQAIVRQAGLTSEAFAKFL